MAITTFRRIEKKYLVSEEEKKSLLPLLYQHMILDPYCENGNTYRIQNIYFDTEQNDLVIRSIAKPDYKEKFRVRKYDGNDYVFIEIKKKSLGIVGKRRIKVSISEMNDFINYGKKPVRTTYIDKEIIDEMDYFLSRYHLQPQAYISYERLGFFDRHNPEFRLTFDNQIHAKRNNFKWDEDDFEENLLKDGFYIMEIKSVTNFPMWLVKALSELKIYPQSFSKYGSEYINYYHPKEKQQNV